MSSEPWISRYIPAGCLKLALGDDALSQSLKDGSIVAWKFLSRSHHDIPEKDALSPAAQKALLSHPSLRPLKMLWSRKWIQAAFLPSHDNPKVLGYLRVYILPHDIESTIIRGHEDDKPSKALAQLLSQLDYSETCWNGHSGAVPQRLPKPQDLSDIPTDDSLLAMFNSVPSPNPQAHDISDLETRETMKSIMNSKIAGLEVELYQYQRASTALMLQREAFPGRTVDPRLRSVVDQEGNNWFYDSVSGVVLREPRYYDGVAGGILAEEMGTGKTLICLALILSTRHEPNRPPDPFPSETPTRAKNKEPGPGPCSLMDIAAATANRNSIAWKPYFEACRAQLGDDYQNCVDALERPENRAFYRIQTDALVEPRRSGRLVTRSLPPPKEIYLSSTSLVVVPNNLVIQWKNEIKKHTSGLNVLILIDKQPIPPATALLAYDLIIFSHGRFEWIQREKTPINESRPVEKHCPLEFIRFKRILFDEGHRLGTGSAGSRTDVMRVVECLHTSARWVVTGTPSKGLYGVGSHASIVANNKEGGSRSESTPKQEKEDLQRIGNLATKFLRVRPWANAKDEAGDSLADWNVYVMSKVQHGRGQNRKDCLKSTLHSLIIRHRLDDISTLLPPVDEKVVYLDGSYQDRLSLNLFSMMIIFNAVQSQRTDADYFFHPRQRKALIHLVNNLRQASFYGGVFFSPHEIAQSLETAEQFLEKRAVKISPEDEELLKKAMDFGKLAMRNDLKIISNKFHSLPLYVEHFPGGDGRGWSLDERDHPNSPVCTDSGMINSLQEFLSPCIDAPTSLQLMIDSGRLYQQGVSERMQALKAVEKDSPVVEEAQDSKPGTLAGHTSLGEDHHHKPKSRGLTKAATIPLDDKSDPLAESAARNIELAEPLARTQIISTASAKLSYLIDAIVQHQHNEQILVFYDNDNIAYYLAGMLDILQIQYLIYARVGLNAERRAQYVATFTQNPKFRVMLMDISQAAYGLDMRTASRIYFISPVLNPQVEAQAIGRARRISSHLGKHVTVETLVLKGSIEEVMVDRKKAMSQAEFRRVNSILDDKPMYEWILNAKILPMPETHGHNHHQQHDSNSTPTAKGKRKQNEEEEEEEEEEQQQQQQQDSSHKSEQVAQTAPLKIPQFVFGRGFGRQLHPDDGLVNNTGSPEAATAATRHEKKKKKQTQNNHGPSNEQPPPLPPRYHHPVRPFSFRATTTTPTTVVNQNKRPQSSPSSSSSSSPNKDEEKEEGGGNGGESQHYRHHHHDEAQQQPSCPPPKKKARITWAD